MFQEFSLEDIHLNNGRKRYTISGISFYIFLHKLQEGTMWGHFKATISFCKFHRNTGMHSGLNLAIALCMILFFLSFSIAFKSYASETIDPSPPPPTPPKLECLADAKKCPKLVAAPTKCKLSNKTEEIEIEPSGLTYDPSREIWVGVSDNYYGLSKCLNPKEVLGYTVFYFKDTGNKFDANFSASPSTIGVKPLISMATAQSAKPYDLEGIEYDPSSDTYYMTGSLALDADPAPGSPPNSRDNAERYKVYKFKVDEVTPGSGEYIANQIDRAYPGLTSNMREWLKANSQTYWFHPSIEATCQSDPNDEPCKTLQDNALNERPEYHGGMNVEALALARSCNLIEKTLTFGLRGPIYEVGSGSNKENYFSFLEITPTDLNPAPVFQGQGFATNLQDIHNTPKELGFRGIAQVMEIKGGDFAVEVYAVVLGLSSFLDCRQNQNEEKCRLEAGLMMVSRNPANCATTATLIKDSFVRLPPTFVGEGISVTDYFVDDNGLAVEVQLVDDLSDRFMWITLYAN